MKSIFGLNENVAAALSYILGPFSGIAVLVMERENKFVRFHALQSTLWFLFIMVVGWILAIFSNIPILGILINPLLGIGGLIAVISALFLMFKAYSNETFKLPIIGDVSWSQINK